FRVQIAHFKGANRGQNCAFLAHLLAAGSEQPGKSTRRILKNRLHSSYHQSVNVPIQLTSQRRAAEDPPFQNGKRNDATQPARPGEFLIADLPIRNGRNPSTLNKILISNRQKNGLFLTAHLRPQRERIFLIPARRHFGGATPKN